MRPALWSVFIQACGSAATFAAALLVSHRLGLAAQGEFGLLRSWLDAGVTLAVLGFPQALLHLQYREAVPVAALQRWVLSCIAVLFTLCALSIVAVWQWWPPLPEHLPRATVLVALAAVPFAAAHQLWRALALREVGVVPYAVMTAAPSLMILLGLVPVCLAGSRSGLAWALFGSAFISALGSGWLVRRGARRPTHCAVGPAPLPVPWSRRVLWSIGLETGCQNVLTALTPAAVLTMAGALGGSLAQVGSVSLGLHVYLLFGVAASYVAPIVYDRAARVTEPMDIRALVRFLRGRTTTQVLLGTAGLAVLAVVLLLWLWPAGPAPALLVAAMALAGVLSMAVRLLVTLL